MSGLRVVGLFAGIGGIERGLHQAGHSTELLCEVDAGAQEVLRTRFPGRDVVEDIRELKSVPRSDVVAAGFPCQDLSQAGLTAGITGEKSGLVDHVFRLISGRGGPKWLLLENVPFMLQLDRGKAMLHLVEHLERLGYRWAYRVVDARAFGKPQRRLRVILLASKTEDPRTVLFGSSAKERIESDATSRDCGFYWTEGLRGLGWAVDAVPTLKGGSTIGIASPPGIWRPSTGEVFTPGLTDVERLQGFPSNWTAPATDVPKVRLGHRWKLVGNAVSVPVARWVGRSLNNPLGFNAEDGALDPNRSWPNAAWGESGVRREVYVSTWPERARYEHLAAFVKEPAPLSVRAAAGFLSRAERGQLRFAPGFLADIREHIAIRDAGVGLAAVS